MMHVFENYNEDGAQTTDTTNAECGPIDDSDMGALCDSIIAALVV